jgi:pimeloyl-ACP methyl ester carboxylesterase
MSHQVEEQRFEVGKGVALFVRHLPGPAHPGVPVLCLHGYWRNGRDFETLAPRLAASRPVLTPDLRGRGRSSYASDVSDYLFERLVEDCWRLLDAYGYEKAVIIGTTLGGLIGLEMATQSAERIAGLVLNDIGPEKPEASVKRMAGHAVSGGLTRAEAIALTRSQNEVFTRGLGEADWERLMLRAYKVGDDGLYVRDFDPLTNQATAILMRERPSFWEELRASAGIPLTVLRGENSDFLTRDIVERMRQARPDLEVAEIRDRGHPPFLNEPDAFEAIDALLARADAAR